MLSNLDHSSRIDLNAGDCNGPKIDLNARDDILGMTGLICAVQKGHKDVVQLILTYSNLGINLNARDGLGRTALTMACYRGYKDVVQLLLEHSDPNARDDLGWTALMIASQSGHEDIVQMVKAKLNP